MKKIIRSIEKCTKCKLHKSRINVVTGEGNLNAEIMFVGEAPGEREDLKGKPFEGKAGKEFENKLRDIGLERKDVYITNIVKCRPPKNRDPTLKEKKTCSEFLDRQIDKIKPKIIVTVGRHSSKYLFEKYGMEFPGINETHGKSFKINENLVLFPVYHPSATFFRKKVKEEFEEDFQKLIREIKSFKIKD